jgi:PPOX class probable F420-dependent enzyme
MATLNDPEVSRLLAEPNHAVVSTINPDGSVLGTVVWIDYEDGVLAVNSAVGRRWPTNLQHDPRVTIVIYEQANPYNFVEIRGTASGDTTGADVHIDRLAKKYLGLDQYPYRQPGEQRITFAITPRTVRHQKQ